MTVTLTLLVIMLLKIQICDSEMSCFISNNNYNTLLNTVMILKILTGVGDLGGSFLSQLSARKRERNRNRCHLNQ